MSLFASRCAHDCVVMCVMEVCYLAVHNEVADAASEVFVLKLRVDVWDVLIHTAKLEHVAHVQVSKTQKGILYTHQHSWQSGLVVHTSYRHCHIYCMSFGCNRQNALKINNVLTTFKLYTISAHR